MREKVSRSLLLSGSIIAGVGVVLGAFGAHGLKTVVAPAMLDTFETAVRYQMYHALGLLAAGVACQVYPEHLSRMFRSVGLLFGCGIVFFSGSLYLLVLSSTSWLGAITPVGGVLFVAGWIVLAMAFLKSALLVQP